MNTIKIPTGLKGDSGNYITVSTEAAGSNCASGGLKIVYYDGRNDSIISTNYVCNGENGENGENGTSSVILNGSGSPSSGDGNNGDYYINTDNADMYFKASDTWSVIINIKGENGQNGENGENGESGKIPMGTSTTSLAMGVGTKTFNMEEDADTLAFQSGIRIRVVHVASGDFMEGVATVDITSNVMQIALEVDYASASNTHNEWNVVVAGEKGLPSSTATTDDMETPEGFDTLCLGTLSDNKLTTLLTSIITNICNMGQTQLIELYGFKANKTSISASLEGSDNVITFEDDSTSPYYDKNNNFYVDKYTAPKDFGSTQFIWENINIGNYGANVVIKIVRNGSDVLAQESIDSADKQFIGSLITGFIEVAEGDIITCVVDNPDDVATLTIDQDTRFSNSFGTEDDE